MFVTTAIAAEVALRALWGLGFPLLMQPAIGMEYIQVPDQDVVRRGNRLQINSLGMRSSAFPEFRDTSEALRVLIFGDSVIFGGSQTDQADLATELLGPLLRERLEREVVVGNVSAGSWGPPNWLGYAQQRGFHQADVVVLVLSSHDASDLIRPGWRPPPSLGPLFPAIHETLRRARPRGLAEAAIADFNPVEPEALRALDDFAAAASESGAIFLAMHFPSAIEASGRGTEPGHEAIASWTSRFDHRGSLDLRSRMAPSPWTWLEHHRDNLHPNAAGQQILAEVLAEVISTSFAEKASNVPMP